MADDGDLQIPAPQGTIDPEANRYAVESAGAGWAATTAGLQQLSQTLGGLGNLALQHEQIADAAQVSALHDKVDLLASATAGANPADPQAFASAMAQQRPALIGGTPGRYAIQMGAYFDHAVAQQQQSLQNAAIVSDTKLHGAVIDNRFQTVTNGMANTLASGAPLGIAEQAPAYTAGMTEASNLIDAKTTWGFGPRTTGNATDRDAYEQQLRDNLGQTLKTAAFKGHLQTLAQGPGGFPAAWAELQRFEAAGSPAASAPTAPSSATAGGPATASATTSSPQGAAPVAASPAPAVQAASDAGATPTASSTSLTVAGAPAPVTAAAPAAPPAPSGTNPAGSAAAPVTAPAPAATPAQWEAGVSITPQERASMGAGGREALTQLQSVVQAYRTQQQFDQTAAQHAMNGRASDELQYLRQYGQPSGKGPSDAEYQATFKDTDPAKLNDYTNAKSAAIQQHFDDGITPGMTSDQIAQRAADKAAGKPLDVTLDSPEKLGGLRLAIFGQEAGVKNGAPQISTQGALGTAQLEPDTAIAIAHAHGITALDGLTPAQQQAALLAHDQQLNVQLGTFAINDLAAKYGSPLAVAAAYHGGFGYVGGEVQSSPAEKAVAAITQAGRDPTDPLAWRDALSGMGMPRTAQYVEDVAGRMKLGQQQAAAAATVQRDSQITAEAVADPLTYAQNHGWGQVAPLNVQGFASSNPQDQQAFASALKARQQQGEVISSQHPTVPARILTSAEAASYRGLLDRNGGAGVQLADAATNALGVPGATEFMREVGQTDGRGTVGMQTAQVAASGPNGRRFANDVTDGLNAQNNPGAKPEQPGALDGWNAWQAKIAPAFAQMDSSQLAAVMGTARTAALGQSQHGTPATPEANIRGALGGATNYQTGEQFGGIDPNVNGKPVVLPTWLKVGTMSSAVQKIASGGKLGPEPPAYSNHQPMPPADLAKLQPEITSDGTYVLRSGQTNQIARVKGGGAYRLNMEAQKDFLSHLGGYVQAGE